MLTSVDLNACGGVERLLSPVEMGFDFSRGSDAQCEMLSQYYRVMALLCERSVDRTLIDKLPVPDLRSETCAHDSGISVGSVDSALSLNQRSSNAEPVILRAAKVKEGSALIKDGNCYLRMILPKWRVQTFQTLGLFPTLAQLQSVLPHKFVSRFILKKIKLFRDSTGVICISDVGDLSAWDVLYFGEPVASSQTMSPSDLIGGVATREREGIVEDEMSAGYCYLNLIEEHDREHVKEKLGAYPTLGAMLSLSFGVYSKSRLWKYGILPTSLTLCHVADFKDKKMNALDVLTAVAHAMIGNFPVNSLGDGLRKRQHIPLPSGLSVTLKCGSSSESSFWTCLMQYGSRVADFCAVMLAYVHWPHDSTIITMVNLIGSDEGVSTVVQHSDTFVKDNFHWHSAAMVDFGPHVNVKNRETDLIFERPANCVRWAVCIPAELPWCMFSNGQIVPGGRMIIYSDQARAIRLHVNLGEYSALSAIVMWSDNQEATWGFSQLKNFYTVRLGAIAHL